MLNTFLAVGYQTRACTIEDAAAIADLSNRWSRATVGVDMDHENNYRSLFQAPGFSMEEDTLLVVDSQGRAAGFADIYDINEPHVRITGNAVVDPDHQGRGIGAYLADWLVQRGRSGLHRAPQGARVVLTEYLPVQERAGAEILERLGFEAVRASYLMRIELSTMPPQPELPEGIFIRPIRMESEFEGAVRVVRQSFRDHYGFVEEPFENSIGRWRYITSHDPHFDPDLWFVALDGEKISGVCYCTPFSDEDPEMGWIQTLGVLREYRGRSVGLALLRVAFSAFYQRGFVKVGLGVDAGSLTGATRLYEKAGMQVYREFHVFEKELRPGAELSTQSLD